MRDTAIRNVHTNVATINAETTAWDDSGNIVVLDEAAIATEITRLQTEYSSKAYARTRATAYPSIGDQLDMLWHAMDVGDWNIKLIKTTSFYTELKAVKDANPKP